MTKKSYYWRNREKILAKKHKERNLGLSEEETLAEMQRFSLDYLVQHRRNRGLKE